MNARCELIGIILNSDLDDETKVEHIKMTYEASDESIAGSLAVAKGETKGVCPPHYPNYTQVPIKCIICGLPASKW